MEQKTSELGQVRCEKSKLARWREAWEVSRATNGGQSWSQWVREALDAAANRVLKKR